jgi:hypothetical protein
MSYTISKIKKDKKRGGESLVSTVSRDLVGVDHGYRAALFAEAPHRS